MKKFLKNILILAIGITMISIGAVHADRTFVLPDQTGQSGKFLKTDGLNPSWGSVGGGITIGTSTITSGTNTRVLYDNSGVIGEYTLTGTGTVVVMATGPTLSNPVVGTQSASDNSTKAASTAYVTNGISTALAGVNPAVAVSYATTAAGDTSGLTYANGTSGVGATLTGANNTVTTIDGHAFVVGDVGVTRLLVKNDTQSPSGAFNGVYLFTALHTGITGDIFTRALDYDMPSDINSTGAIPVVSGTTNTGTSWIITSTVTTVGVDSLTYSNFTLNPASLVTLTGNQALTNKTYNGNTFTAGTGTLTIAAGKTLTVSNILTLAGTDSTTMTFPSSSDTVAGLAATQTLTNKRINPRVNTITSSTTPTPAGDTTDEFTVTALAAGATFAAPTGTPVDGQPLTIRIKDNATPQTLAWNGIYRASSDLALPTTTITSKTMYLKFIYNAVDSKWDFVAFLNNF